MKDLARVAVVISKPTFHSYMVPLGYLYVIACLREAGHQVCVLNFSSSDPESYDHLRTSLAAIRPDLVIAGTSYKFHNNCPSSTISSAIQVSRTAKELCRGCCTLLIGPLNTVMEAVLLKDPAVDAVALGEPEDICVEVTRAVTENTSLSEVAGLALLKKHLVERTAKRPYPDVNRLPIPDRESVTEREFIFPSYFSNRTTELLSSRGCPFQCTYCFGAQNSRRQEHNVGPAFRATDPEKVIEEIDLLYSKWNVRGIKFSDVEFCVSAKRVEAISRLLVSRKYPDLRWRVVTRVTSVDPSLLKLMHDAGCRHIYYGVESGDEAVLASMNKKISLEEIRTTFKDTWKAGIKPEASFLLGVPGETLDSAKRTIKFANELSPFLVTFHVFVPFPGIPLEEKLKTISDMTLDQWDVYQLKGGISYCYVPALKLDQLSRKAYRDFYLRPGTLARMILQLGDSAFRGYIVALATGNNEGSWLRNMLFSKKRLPDK